MRAQILPALVLSAWCVSAVAQSTKIPTPNEVSRYEREKPVFRSKVVPKERGDTLLKLLDGGRAVRQVFYKGSPGAISDPPLSRLRIALVLTNGVTLPITFYEGGDFHLANGVFAVTNYARLMEVQRVLEQMEMDLEQEVLRTPKPFTYRVGTLRDAGTLTGIAGLVYGDTNQWRRIWRANRNTLEKYAFLPDDVHLIIPDK